MQDSTANLLGTGLSRLLEPSFLQGPLHVDLTITSHMYIAKNFPRALLHGPRYVDFFINITI